MSRPPHDSEVPRRQPAGEEALPTAQDAPERQAVPGHKGKGTTQVELAKIAAEREVKLAEIAAAEHETTGERIARILGAVRPLAETCAKGTAGILIAAALILAVYYGRSFSLFGVAKTGGGEPAPALQPLRSGEDDTPPGAPETLPEPEVPDASH